MTPEDSPHLELPTAGPFEAIVSVILLSGCETHLAGQDKDTLAKLGQDINETFNQWNSIIKNSGGNTFRLTGDVLLAVWPTGEPNTLETTRRCLQGLVDEVKAPLSIRTGLALGEAEAFKLNDEPGRTFIGGKAVIDAWRAALHPTSPSLHSSEKACVERPSRSSTNLTGSDELQKTWAPTLKTIHCVSAHIVDVDHKLESIIQAYETAQEVLHLYSPPREHAYLDNSGLVVITILERQGLPTDEAFRAVQAGLALHRRLLERGFRADIGITNGLAFTNQVPFGSPISRATRLMYEAQNEVLVSDAIALTTRERFSFGQTSGNPIEGALTVHPQRSGIRLRAPFHRPSPFGRSRELRRLDDACSEARVGRSAKVIIVGEPGMGKSLLLQTIGDRARYDGMAVAIGAADALEQRESFRAIRGVLRSLLSTSPEAFHRRATLQKTFGPRFNLLSAVLPEFEAPRELSEGPHGTSRGEALRIILTDIITHIAAESPLLMGIEDAHFLDSASLRLLEELPEIAGLTLIITSRPAHSSEAAHTHLLETTPQIPLEPLSSEALQLVVSSTLETPVSLELVKFIESYTAGHPLYSQELAVLLKQTGRLQPDGRTLTLEPEHPLTISTQHNTLEGLLKRRIQGLDKATQLVLMTASVIDTDFPTPLLMYALRRHLPPSVIHDALKTLASERILEAQSSPLNGAEPWYAFRHPLTREVSYGLLESRLRREIHLSVGIWHETYNSAKSSLSTLAHHFDRAQDETRSRFYSAEAGEAAIRAGAYREGVELIERSIQLLGEEDRQERVRLYNYLAEAYRGLGDTSSRREAAEQALILVGRAVPSSPLGLVCSTLQSLNPWPITQTGWIAEETARALRQAAGAYYFQSRSLATFQAAIAAFRYAYQAGPCTTLACATVELGGAIGLIGIDSLARYLFDYGLRVARSVNDVRASAYACFLRSLYCVGRGEWSQVEEDLDFAQAVFRDHGDEVLWGNTQTVRFWLDFYRGYLDDARIDLDSLHAQVRRSGNQQHEAWRLRGIGVLHLTDSRNREAIRALQASLVIAGQDRMEQLTTFGCLAACYAQNGDHDLAQAALNEGLCRLRNIRRPTIHVIFKGSVGLLEAALRLHGPHHPNTVAAYEGLARCRSVFPIANASFFRLRGDLAAARQHPDAAQGAWHKAFDFAQRLGLNLELHLLEERLYQKPA